MRTSIDRVYDYLEACGLPRRMVGQGFVEYWVRQGYTAAQIADVAGVEPPGKGV